MSDIFQSEDNTIHKRDSDEHTFPTWHIRRGLYGRHKHLHDTTFPDLYFTLHAPLQNAITEKESSWQSKFV